MGTNFSQDELNRYTLEVFQPLSPCPLTLEDAREIRMNMTNFFSLLLEWNYQIASKTPANKRVNQESGYIYNHNAPLSGVNK